LTEGHEKHSRGKGETGFLMRLQTHGELRGKMRKKKPLKEKKGRETQGGHGTGFGRGKKTGGAEKTRNSKRPAKIGLTASIVSEKRLNDSKVETGVRSFKGGKKQS